MDKIKVYEALKALVAERMALSQINLDRLNESSHEETKSSAGDKFETSREMLRQELNKAEAHLNQFVVHQKQLQGINPDLVHSAVDFGSLVQTNLGTFLISIAIGKFKLENESYYAISAESPMAEALMGKSVGEEVSVNGRGVKIFRLV